MNEKQMPPQSDEQSPAYTQKLQDLAVAGLDLVQQNAQALHRSASDTLSEAGDKVLGLFRQADENREEIKDQLNTAAQATRVVATVAAAGAAVTAPTGLAAVGVSLGVVSAPVLVTAAPILLGVAAGAGALSAGAALYTKYRKGNKDKE